MRKAAYERAEQRAAELQTQLEAAAEQLHRTKTESQVSSNFISQTFPPATTCVCVCVSIYQEREVRMASLEEEVKELRGKEEEYTDQIVELANVSHLIISYCMYYTM